MHEVRVPLVTVTRTEFDEKHTRLSYYVGDLLILDMEILKELVPAVGPVNDITLVQLLVTPHEHMSLLGDILAHSRAGETSGNSWDALMTRTEQLLVPPSR